MYLASILIGLSGFSIFFLSGRAATSPLVRPRLCRCSKSTQTLSSSAQRSHKLNKELRHGDFSKRKQHRIAHQIGPIRPGGQRARLAELRWGTEDDQLTKLKDSCPRTGAEYKGVKGLAGCVYSHSLDGKEPPQSELQFSEDETSDEGLCQIKSGSDSSWGPLRCPPTQAATLSASLLWIQVLIVFLLLQDTHTVKKRVGGLGVVDDIDLTHLGVHWLVTRPPSVNWDVTLEQQTLFGSASQVATVVLRS